jgi:hypothetical protein
MKKGTGSRKGHEYERLISRKLTKWLTGSEYPEIFWRSASSGAKATQSVKFGHQSKMQGDIVSTDAVSMFFIDGVFVECKSYKDFRLESILLEKGSVWDWWSKCKVESEACNKVPLLVFKKNRSPDWFMIQRAFFSKLTLYSGDPPFSCFDIADYVVGLFDSLLGWTDKSTWIQALGGECVDSGYNIVEVKNDTIAES